MNKKLPNTLLEQHVSNLDIDKQRQQKKVRDQFTRISDVASDMESIAITNKMTIKEMDDAINQYHQRQSARLSQQLVVETPPLELRFRD